MSMYIKQRHHTWRVMHDEPEDRKETIRDDRIRQSSGRLIEITPIGAPAGKSRSTFTACLSHDTRSLLEHGGMNRGRATASQHQTSHPPVLFACSITRNSRKNRIRNHGYYFISDPRGRWDCSIILSFQPQALLVYSLTRFAGRPLGSPPMRSTGNQAVHSESVSPRVELPKCIVKLEGWWCVTRRLLEANQRAPISGRSDGVRTGSGDRYYRQSRSQGMDTSCQ